MGKQLRWGVCGVGMIAHDFLTAMATLPAEQHRAYALAGKDRERTLRLASLHQVPRTYETYEALANDESVDIVFVSVVNLQHYEVSRLMLEGGKHVLCEKPLGATQAQARALAELARRRRLFLLEGMWSRFFPAYEALGKHIADGGLGDVYHVNVQFGVEINDIERTFVACGGVTQSDDDCPKQSKHAKCDKNTMKDLGGGAVLDLGVYMLQLVQWVYKAAPTALACAGHVGATGADEAAACALRYPGARTAAIAAHTRVALPNRAEIIGTKGSVTLDYFWCPTTLRLSAANCTEWTLPRGRFNFHFHNSAGLSYEIQECYDCITNNLLESPKLPLDESILLAKLADTMRAQLGVLQLDP